MIITSTILPPSTTALNFAPRPVPIPTTSKSGADVLWPFVCISTKVTFPSVTIGFSCAFFTSFYINVIDFLRFKILDP